jgi:hypothetical protein
MAHTLQQPRSTTTVLYIGWMNDRADQQAYCVGEDVPFAPPHLFLGSIAARTTYLSRETEHEANGGAQCGKPACCVRRGGDRR